MSNERMLTALARTIVLVHSVGSREEIELFADAIDLPHEQIAIVDAGDTDAVPGRGAGTQYQRLTCASGASFAERCNAGIDWALGKGARYVGLCNGNNRLLTPVMRPLMQLLLDDNGIGAVSPALVTQTTGGLELAQRAEWDLSALTFGADRSGRRPCAEILEADYCELEFVLFPSSVLADVGSLDPELGSELVAADFGLRLRRKGYRAVSYPKAQILRLSDQRMAGRDVQEALEQGRQARRRFSIKHLQCGVNYQRVAQTPNSSWSVADGHLHDVAVKWGLNDASRPTAQFSHPGFVTSPYLFTVWETTQLPRQWAPKLASYDRVFVPSRWNVEVFQKSGYAHVSHVPLGHDPDSFHPWGAKFDFGTERAFLHVCFNHYRKGLDVTIRAWQAMRRQMPDARLFLFGRRIQVDRWLSGKPRWTWLGKMKHSRYDDDQITVLEPMESLSSDEVASLYRGARCLVLNSRSEGFGFPIVEAMGCGTLAIVPNYGAAAEFIDGRNCLSHGGTPIEADYSDRGFHDVGQWWEPSLDEVERCMREAYVMEDSERREMTGKARQFVLNRFTWRNSAVALARALEEFQEPRPRKLSRATLLAHASERRPIAVSLQVRTAAALAVVGDKMTKFADILARDGALAAVRMVGQFTRDSLRRQDRDLAKEPR